ncbi:hypothetical protein [Sutcliffiella rhizosphaerae]|uniref:hypothetical protein n=1 Tax=Sutcliffiella rhizosphaerae TaxID=2880967 RepID=UPI001E541106|nr:hypothetical protein [Sutcliffiella rhizosphaerae]
MEDSILKTLVVVVSISIVLFACNQLLYNYAKKEKSFMKHRKWDKMFIVIFIWLIFSFSLFILLFIMTPLEGSILQHAWLMFIVVYYFLFFIHLFVLSIVHKINSSALINNHPLDTCGWLFDELLQ